LIGGDADATVTRSMTTTIVFKYQRTCAT